MTNFWSLEVDSRPPQEFPPFRSRRAYDTYDEKMLPLVLVRPGATLEPTLFDWVSASDRSLESTLFDGGFREAWFLEGNRPKFGVDFIRRYQRVRGWMPGGASVAHCACPHHPNTLTPCPTTMGSARPAVTRRPASITPVRCWTTPSPGQA